MAVTAIITGCLAPIVVRDAALAADNAVIALRRPAVALKGTRVSHNGM